MEDFIRKKSVLQPLSDAAQCSSRAASEAARVSDEAARQIEGKKSAVPGQRALMRTPRMGYFFASRLSFQRLPPGDRTGSVQRNTARVSATRRGLLLPAHMGQHEYQRSHCHCRHHLLRCDFPHSSARGPCLPDGARAACVDASSVM